MKHPRNYKYSLLVLILIFVFWGISYFAGHLFEFFRTAEAIAEYVRSFGAWGPLAVIAIVMGEVVFAPLPGYFITIASGLIYGPFLGGIYAIAGNILGSLLAFWIARRFGKEIVAHFISPARFEKYEAQMERHQYFFWLFYFLPIFPVDVLSFAFGASAISYRRFLLVITFGFICNISILNATAGGLIAFFTR